MTDHHTGNLIFLDTPQHWTGLARNTVISGWFASDGDTEGSIEIDGRPVAWHPVDRPDVARDHPTKMCIGFLLFYEPSKDAEHLVIRLGDALAEREIMAAAGYRAQAEEDAANKAAHRVFLRSALCCPICRKPTMGEGVGLRCSCGASYDWSRGLNMIPSSFRPKDIKFNGAICSRGYDQDVENIIASAGMVLDCGAGSRHSTRPNVIATGILQYPSTDVVCGDEHLPFLDNSFDVVLSLDGLKHVRNPYVCAKELTRVLKPGGRIVAVTPDLAPVHGFPLHFFNPTPSGLAALFDGQVTAQKVTVPRAGHPLPALKDYLKALLGHMGPSDIRGMTLDQIAAMSTDDILSRFEDQFAIEGINELAANYMLIGTKHPSMVQHIHDPTAPFSQGNFPELDVVWYRDRHPDLARHSDDGLEDHYAQHGRIEGRRGSPLAARESFLQAIEGIRPALEIGPFANPVLEGEQVRYLDVLDSNGLHTRASALGISTDRLPGIIHYVGELSLVAEQFPLVLSCHSIMHQPDLVAHLNGVSRILSPGGLYAMIVPDYRFCFDHFMGASSVADVLQAHVEKRRRLAASSIIEHRTMTTHNDAVRHWNGDHGSPEPCVEQIPTALLEMQQADYVDVHAWRFCPDTFREIIGDLWQLRLTRLRPLRVYDTPFGRGEFCAVLELIS
jgi:SAM-dependent methyltransferase